MQTHKLPHKKTRSSNVTPKRTPSDLQVQWEKIGAIHQRVFLTENLRRSDPHQTFAATAAAAATAATAAPTTHKPKPTQLNGQTAAAASTHICRGLTITNHITFPICSQPRFGPHDQPFWVAIVMTFAA